MGAVKVQVRLENHIDRVNAEQGLLPASQVRAMPIEALADTDAVMNLFSRDVVEYLGVPIGDSVIVTLADERREEMPMADGIHLEVAGRRVALPCLVGPPQCEALLGQVMLEVLDLVVDCPGRRLLPNPASPICPSLSLK